MQTRNNKTISEMRDAFFAGRPYIIGLTKITVDSKAKKVYLVYKNKRIAMVYIGETNKRHKSMHGFIARKGLKDTVCLERLRQVGVKIAIGLDGEWIVECLDPNIPEYYDGSKVVDMDKISSKRGFVWYDFANKKVINPKLKEKK